MPKASRADIQLSRVLPWRAKVDWRSVGKLLDEVDVTRDPREAGEHDWPLAWHLAKAPHPVLVACVARGMPLHPRDTPGLVVSDALNHGAERNLAFILREASEKLAKGARRAQLSGTVEQWAQGGAEGVRYHGGTWRAMLKALVAAGADLDQYNDWGRTPLLTALTERCFRLDPEVGWSGKASLRARAEAAGYLERAMILLETGADPSLPLRSKTYEADGRWPIGATPLFARPYGDGRLHRALLAAGADPLARCVKPAAWNAIEYAEVCLERLTHGTTVFTAPKTGRKIELDNEPMPDDPAAVRRVIAAMKKAPVSRKRKK